MQLASGQSDWIRISRRRFKALSHSWILENVSWNLSKEFLIKISSDSTFFITKEFFPLVDAHKYLCRKIFYLLQVKLCKDKKGGIFFRQTRFDGIMKTYIEKVCWYLMPSISRALRQCLSALSGFTVHSHGAYFKWTYIPSSRLKVFLKLSQKTADLCTRLRVHKKGKVSYLEDWSPLPSELFRILVTSIREEKVSILP